MVDITVFGDLPSFKFDKKFQEDIEYKKLEAFEKKITKKHELNSWIEKFKNELEKYFDVEYNSWSTDLRKKRCRDLNYWVRKVQGKISELLIDPKLSECVLRFQNDIPPIFEKNVNFKCKRYEDSSTKLEVRKKLDDYCENRDYIKENIDEKKNKDYCLIYNTYNRENDEIFNKEDSSCKQKYYEPKHCMIHDKCTIKNKTETFPQIDCDQYDVSYDSENNSLLKKVLLSTPVILGICALFLFLYKYTPLFSLILTGKFKRKINDILTEDKQEISERITEYSPIYTENDKNSIGYNMIPDEKIKDDELPSNKYKKDLLKNIKIEELEDTCKSEDTKYNCISQAVKFCTSLYLNYHTIRKIYCELPNDPKCCIDVNYYIDYVNEIIKSSKFNDSTKEEYIQKIEQIWKEYFGKTHAYKCKREENTHSKYERCIINQLSDFSNDKNYLENASSQNSNIYTEYDQYIQEKLSNILKCEKLNSENINISINGQPIAQKIKCNNLPLKSQQLKNIIINNVQNIKVTFSDEAIRSPARDHHSHTPIEESRITHSTGFAEIGSSLVIEHVDETNSSFTRIIVTVISMILGIFFLFLMLYKV